MEKHQKSQSSLPLISPQKVTQMGQITFQSTTKADQFKAMDQSVLEDPIKEYFQKLLKAKKSLLNNSEKPYLSLDEQAHREQLKIINDQRQKIQNKIQTEISKKYSNVSKEQAQISKFKSKNLKGFTNLYTYAECDTLLQSLNPYKQTNIALAYIQEQVEVSKDEMIQEAKQQLFQTMELTAPEKALLLQKEFREKKKLNTEEEEEQELFEVKDVQSGSEEQESEEDADIPMLMQHRQLLPKLLDKNEMGVNTFNHKEFMLEFNLNFKKRNKQPQKKKKYPQAIDLNQLEKYTVNRQETDQDTGNNFYENIVKHLQDQEMIKEKNLLLIKEGVKPDITTQVEKSPEINENKHHKRLREVQEILQKSRNYKIKSDSIIEQFVAGTYALFQQKIFDLENRNQYIQTQRKVQKHKHDPNIPANSIPSPTIVKKAHSKKQTVVIKVIDDKFNSFKYHKLSLPKISSFEAFQQSIEQFQVSCLFTPSQVVIEPGIKSKIKPFENIEKKPNEVNKFINKHQIIIKQLNNIYDDNQFDNQRFKGIQEKQDQYYQNIQGKAYPEIDMPFKYVRQIEDVNTNRTKQKKV